MEPKLTAEEQAEKDAEDALIAKERAERLRDTWGTSPEQLASQATLMGMVGAEG